MPGIPETRASLILRLHDVQDFEAWEEFLTIYESLIYRLARKQGMQHADAQELVQEVLLAVSKSVGNWEPDPERGPFRAWLLRIVRNLTINHLTRRRHRAIASGDSQVTRLLEQSSEPALEESDIFDLEYRREIFRQASAQVREAVADNTWQAFWLTSVEATSAADAARQLGMTVGSVYIARSRVMARLREVVRRYDGDSTEA